MPIYTYHCERCDKETEKLMKVSEIDNPQFCDCKDKNLLTRTITSAGIQFNGKWFSNSGEY